MAYTKCITTLQLSRLSVNGPKEPVGTVTKEAEAQVRKMVFILQWPFMEGELDLARWATEAKKMSKTLATMARQEAKENCRNSAINAGGGGVYYKNIIQEHNARIHNVSQGFRNIRRRRRSIL